MAETGSDFLAQRLHSSYSTLSPFKKDLEAEAEKLLNLCKETIRKSIQQWSTAKGVSGHFLINKCKCDLLVEKLSGVQRSLDIIHQSKLHDGSKTNLLLQELHRTLLDADALINASSMTSSNWPRAAIEQGDMGRTFSKLLYDVKWCTVLLLSTLEPKSGFENFGTDNDWFNEDFYQVLSKKVGLKLMIAIFEDETSLRNHLISVKFDNDPNEIKQGFADQLLKQMEASSRCHLLFLKPEGLDFELVEFIGRGAFGTVQTTNFLGRLCAMKIILTRQEEVKVSFLKELEVIKELGHHPHLVRLFCYSQKGDIHYLIMEKMQMDLMRAIGLSGVRDSRINAVSLMLQIGEGVKYIHSKGVAHRDLKPENVLVNLENWPSSKSLSKRIIAVKIADFGVSKTKEASKTCSGQTTGTGTTLYMAPEVLKVGVDDPDKAKLNPMKADVFSFAIMCSVILTGKSPYHDCSLGLVQKKKHVREGTLRPTLPAYFLPRLAPLIRKCWARNPSERPLFDEICRELREGIGRSWAGESGMFVARAVAPRTTLFRRLSA